MDLGAMPKAEANALQDAIAANDPESLTKQVVAAALADSTARAIIVDFVSKAPSINRIGMDAMSAFAVSEEGVANAVALRYIEAIADTNTSHVRSFVKNVCLQSTPAAMRIVCAVNIEFPGYAGPMKAAVYSCSDNFPEKTDECWNLITIPDEEIEGAVVGAVKSENAPAAIGWLSLEISRYTDTSAHARFWDAFLGPLRPLLVQSIQDKPPTRDLYLQLQAGRRAPDAMWEHAAVSMMQGVVPTPEQKNDLVAAIGDEVVKSARDFAMASDNVVAKSIWRTYPPNE